MQNRHANSHSSPDLPRFASAQPPSVMSSFNCIGCGYNFTGLTIGGICPECGRPIEESIAALRRQETCGAATASMVLGIVSLTACALCGPVALVYYYKARKQLATGHYSRGSHGMAKAGLIMGIISTAITGVMGGLFLVGGL
ncbi:MAG: DUF4190 domain-containing protein [Phycisphaerales bacterium]|nr:DUF4190 domain-containing protein [Phycisphaerales bacterium]